MFQLNPKDVPAKCLTPKCDGRVGYIDGIWHGGRGLCKVCHGAASSLVKRKKATWARLEALGLCLPKQNASLFLAAYAEAERKIEEKKLTQPAE